MCIAEFINCLGQSLPLCPVLCSMILYYYNGLLMSKGVFILYFILIVCYNYERKYTMVEFQELATSKPIKEECRRLLLKIDYGKVV